MSDLTLSPEGGMDLWAAHGLWCIGGEMIHHALAVSFWSLLTAFLLSYLLGSLMGGSIIGRLKKSDLRKGGSGNLGATNALRLLGWSSGLSVLLIDVGKAVISVWLLTELLIQQPMFMRQPFWLCETSADISRALCFVGVILGHMFPIWHKFKGGKGVATFLGGLAVLNWVALIAACLVWLIIVLFSGFVSIGSMLAAVAASIAVGVTQGWLSPSFIAVALVTVLIIWAHRSNIRNLKAGKEHQMSQLMLFKPKTKTE